MKTWMLFISVFIFANVTQAKTVSVEWESTEGAKVYDLEWTKVPASPTDQPFSVQVSSPSWTGTLQPGTYQMRVRSRDHRKVPGDWSAPEEFKVGLDTVSEMIPAANEIRKSTQPEKDLVTFKWKAVEGAQSYSFQLSSDDGAIQELHSVKEPEITLKLSVAKKYNWSVEAQAGESMASDKSQTQSFTLIGKQLEEPNVKQEENSSALKWTMPAHAEAIDIALFWHNIETGKWEKLETIKDSKSTEMPFEKGWIGGEYIVQLKAKGTLREPSETTRTRFYVKDLNRAPAAENTFVLKRQLERRVGLFALAQQQISMIEYSSTNADQSQNGHFSTLGGQARLGVGKFGEGAWGFLGAAEFGGLYIDGRSFTSSTFEMTGISRETDDEGETRHYFGVFVKELPMLSSTNHFDYNVDRASAFGPRYGYEKNWVLGARTGAQASLQTYFNLFKLRTPNGTDLSPSLSLQLAVLGSYKLTTTAIGYYGYTYRMDSISYRSTSTDSTNNKIEMSGHHLNFYLEWAL